MKFKSKSAKKRIVVGPAREPKMVTKDYTQVACEFTDELEHFCVLREFVEVSFWNQNLNLEIVSGRIIDLCTRDKEEYIKMDSLTEIRIDKIFEIKNG